MISWEEENEDESRIKLKIQREPLDVLFFSSSWMQLFWEQRRLFPPHWGSVELGQSLCFDVEINLNTCAAIGPHQMRRRRIIQIFFLSLIKNNLDSNLEQKTSLIYEISNASKVVLKLVIGLMVHFTSPEMFVLSFE